MYKYYLVTESGCAYVVLDEIDNLVDFMEKRISKKNEFVYFKLIGQNRFTITDYVSKQETTDNTNMISIRTEKIESVSSVVAD